MDLRIELFCGLVIYTTSNAQKQDNVQIIIEILLKLLVIKTPDESLRITTKPNQIDDGRVKLKKKERKNHGNILLENQKKCL